MSGLVPGLEGDTLLEQMNKLFEPPGNQLFFQFEFSIFYSSCHQATSLFSFSFQYFIDHAARQPVLFSFQYFIDRPRQATKGWTTWARLIRISRGRARVTTMIVVTLAKKEEHW